MTSVLCESDADFLPEDCVWATYEELQSVYAVPGAFSAFLDAVRKRISQ